MARLFCAPSRGGLGPNGAGGRTAPRRCLSSILRALPMAAVLPQLLACAHGLDAGHVQLNSGITIPRIGFGTASMPSDHSDAVLAALRHGYRLVDTASVRHPAYQPGEVGRAIAESGLLRSEVFIESKADPWAQGYESTLADVAHSLKALRTDYLDVFLIHLPQCLEDRGCDGTWRDTWRAMESLFDRGVLRAIGVSNFDGDLLAELLAFARIPPAVVQNRHDPLAQDWGVIERCKELGVFYQSFSTLGRQWVARRPGTSNPVLEHPSVRSIAAKHAMDPAQVVLHWALQSGLGVLPKSSRLERIASNFVGGAPLDTDDMARLRAMDGQHSEEKPVGQVAIKFRNASPGRVLLYWVPDGRPEIQVAALDAGSTVEQGSWVGHSFVAKDDLRGTELGRYTVERSQTFEITPGAAEL